MQCLSDQGGQMDHRYFLHKKPVCCNIDNLSLVFDIERVSCFRICFQDLCMVLLAMILYNYVTRSSEWYNCIPVNSVVVTVITYMYIC